MEIRLDKKYIYLRFLLITLFLIYSNFILYKVFRYSESILFISIIISNFIIHQLFVTKIEKNKNQLIFKNIFNITISSLEKSHIKYKITYKTELDWDYGFSLNYLLKHRYNQIFYVKLKDHHRTIRFNNLILANKSKNSLKSILK